MEEMASGYAGWLGIQWISNRGQQKRSGPPAGGLGEVLWESMSIRDTAPNTKYNTIILNIYSDQQNI